MLIYNWILTFLLLFSGITAQAFDVPALGGPVMDLADFINPEHEQKLTSALHALKQQTGTQLQVLTLPNLDGLPIEQASIKIVDQWKLGSQKEDKGVLLLVSRQERKLRIEVGQGLEGVLTDAYAKRIIAEDIVPLFKAGDTSTGIFLGVYNIVLRTDPDFDIQRYLDLSTESYSEGHYGHRKTISGFKAILIVAVLLMFIFFSAIGSFFGGGRRLRRGGWDGGGWTGGSGWGGGSGGGWGGGGGGWGGGGGGFSGGGASGDW